MSTVSQSLKLAAIIGFDPRNSIPVQAVAYKRLASRFEPRRGEASLRYVWPLSKSERR